MAIKKPSEVTWIDMANRALGRLSMNFIKSFDEGTNSALQAETSLSDAIQEVLNSNNWKSATKTQYLHPQAERSLDGCDVYNLPPDFIRLVQVYEEPDEWRREGHAIFVEPKIRTDMTRSDLLIRYVAFPDFPGTLDPLLISAITMLAAYKMSLSMTADTSIQATLYQESSIALTAARLAENQGEPDIMYETNDWKKEY